LKRVAFVLGGAIGFGLVAYIVIGIFGHWYENNVAKSEDDLSLAYLWFLIVLAASVLAGGVIGNWLAKRSANFSRDQ